MKHRLNSETSKRSVNEDGFNNVKHVTVKNSKLIDEKDGCKL